MSLDAARDALSEPTIHIADDAGTCTIRVEANLLRQGQVDLCLVQSAAPAVDAIRRDSGRPSTVAAIRDLIAGSARHADPVAAELAPGLNPIVVVAPEFAFGSGDWDELDEIIRSSRRPIVFVGGFGASLGETVLGWAAQEPNPETTSRHLTWTTATAPIANHRPVNGAWCWLHGFSEQTHCFVFLKNHLEQRFESVAFADLQEGTTVLNLAFSDCDLLPLICADLVQSEADGPHTALRRMERHLEDARGSQSPVLITGSLYQNEPSNENWAVAIYSWLSTVARDRPALIALANVAIDRPVPLEAHDQWRALTGTFSRLADCPRNQAALPAARPVKGQGFRGAVLRNTKPYVASGPIWWGPFRPTGEQFYWRVAAGMPLDTTGIPSPVRPPAPSLDVEVVRFAKRASAGAPACPRIESGFVRLAARLEGDANEEGEPLIRSLLHGLQQGRALDADRLSDEPDHSALRAGLEALATLLSEASLDWRVIAGEDGQLRMEGHDLNVLVWRDPTRSHVLMRHDMGAWATETQPHPRLTVIAAGPFGAPIPGLIEPQPRDEFSNGPVASADLGLGGSLAPTDSDFTQTRVRQIACVRLERVAEVYMHFDPQQDRGRMDDLLDELLRYFPAAA